MKYYEMLDEQKYKLYIGNISTLKARASYFLVIMFLVIEKVIGSKIVFLIDLNMSCISPE